MPSATIRLTAAKIFSNTEIAEKTAHFKEVATAKPSDAHMHEQLGRVVKTAVAMTFSGFEGLYSLARGDKANAVAFGVAAAVALGVGLRSINKADAFRTRKTVDFLVGFIRKDPENEEAMAVLLRLDSGRAFAEFS
jgi:hypothetical protein